MSFKQLQLSWLSSTHEKNIRMLIKGPGSALPANPDDARFLRSWLVYDSALDLTGTQGLLSRNRLLGLALAISISAGFWAGVGLFASHLFR